MTGPINPDITKISPAQAPGGPESSKIGGQDDASRADSFKLPQDQKGPQEGKETEKSGQANPFDIAQQQQKQSQPQAMSQQQMEEKLNQLNEHFNAVKSHIQDPGKAQGLTDTHIQAMNRVIDKMNPDMKTIAQTTGQQFTPPNLDAKGQSPLNSIMEWVNGSQDTLNGALSHLSTMEKPDMATYMKLQYSVQRATQRGELFSSIISSSVSGIKTLMSLQLG